MATVDTADWAKRHFDGLRRRIDAVLEHFSDFGPGCPESLKSAIRYSLLSPGKRLRPLLVLLAAEAAGADAGTASSQESVEAALPAAAAVEMIHAYSLIHDDLPAMDDDDLRRGRPTCHKQFGEAMAILAGDALLTLAFEVISTGIAPRELAAACCGELARAAGATCLVGGQADDIEGQSAEVSLERLEAIHRRKTGAMIEVSLRLGGMIAGGDEPHLAALTEYGRCLGLAFQITDDLLDATGDEGDVGKRVGKDTTSGKLTFPALLGVEASRQRVDELINSACHILREGFSRCESLQVLARSLKGRTH